MDVRFWSFMASQFCARSNSKRLFLRIVQVTMKHDPFDATYEVTQTLHPPYIHLLRCSLKRSVKQTWTHSAISTNERA